MLLCDLPIVNEDRPYLGSVPIALLVVIAVGDYQITFQFIILRRGGRVGSREIQASGICQSSGGPSIPIIANFLPGSRWVQGPIVNFAADWTAAVQYGPD